MTDPAVPAPRDPVAAPPLASMPLEDVAQLRNVVAPALEDALTRGVRWLRLSGASWAVVARALGVTRQAAWERYRHVDDYGVALVLEDGVASMRCEMTGATFRDPAEVARAGRAVLEASTVSSQQGTP